MKILRLIGMALVAIILSVNFAACSDDELGDDQVKVNGVLYTIDLYDDGVNLVRSDPDKIKGHVDIPSEVYHKATDKTYPVISINFGFIYCYNLTSASVPSSVKSVYHAFVGCPSLTSVNLVNGVTDMSEAFMECSSLVSVNIPSSVTEMSEAFRNCSGLTSVTFEEGLVSISKSAFDGDCASLTHITLPKSLESIGEGAFGGCGCLTSVRCLSSTPPVCHRNGVFSRLDTLYVPKGSAEAYKKANEWKYFENIIEE